MNLRDQDVERMFSLPLSQLATSQLVEVQELMQERIGDSNANDNWNYTWGSAKYSSRKAYSLLIGHIDASPLFSWLWASSNLGKHTNSSSGYFLEID